MDVRELEQNRSHLEMDASCARAISLNCQPASMYYTEPMSQPANDGD